MPPPGREKPDSVIKRWWSYDGLTNVDELRLILSGMMLRRTRDEVRTEMPKLRRIILPIGIDRKIYEKKEDETALELTGDDQKSPADAMRATMSLWACLGRLKVAPAVEWIADYTSGKDRPLVVFFHHHEVGDMLASEISRQMSKLRVARIDGQVTGGRRDDIIQAFQRGEIEVLLAATKAAGESITLTRACDCLMVERQWTAYSEEQAEGRIDRHGQTEPTSATYLCGSIEGQTTLDDDMEELVGARRQMAVDVLDADAVQQAEGWTILACAEKILNRRDNRE
jgi:SNF2 family DNA or RNA helicase